MSLQQYDPNRLVEPSDALLQDLYEMSYPPRDEEYYYDLIDWSAWSDPM
ncbi:hypothetical protein [Brevibacillus dissolubilis]|nr:hypothetical protein [Brevibacillus dissolubilis]